MRTTLVIDDALLRQAKRRAADRDLTVSEVVNQALRDAFREPTSIAAPFLMVTYGPADRRVTHHPADLAAESEFEDRSGLER